VDDVLITGSCEKSIIAVKDYLHQVFTIKDLGYAKYFLGIEIARSSKGTFISQKKYVQDILKDTGLQDSKCSFIPMPRNHKFDESSPLYDDVEAYRRLVGRLLYLNMTRPDISFSVQQLSQHVAAPTHSHWDSALQVIRYLRGTLDMGSFYSTEGVPELISYCDSDWASCPTTRRSITGYCVSFAGSLISWKSKKQLTVSRSSCEAEYRSMATSVCELLWISYLLKDLVVTISYPIPFYCDNQAAIHISSNPVFHERTKHIDVDCHVIRQ